MPEFPTPKTHRLIFIDLMRGIAALWMIETHVVNAFLNYQYQAGWFFNALSISNGYVAVGFIFCAGSGFSIAASRKVNDYKRFAPSFWLYLRRLGFILAAAYWAHFPEFSFWRIIQSTPQQILEIVQCDVLHCIVFSSLIALILVIVLPKKLPFNLLFALLACLIFFATPLVWAAGSLNILPVFPATLFVHEPISPFPLFPWSGYFFAGAAITGWFVQSNNQKMFAQRLVILGIVLPFILFFIKYLPFTYPGWQDWWFASPAHALFRTSGAILLFGALYLGEEFFAKIPRVKDVLRLCGTESLFIYLLQGMLIYGSVANVGVKHFLPTIVTPLQIIILTAALIAVCYSLAHIWNTYKNHDALRARRTIALLSILFLIVFMLVPA